MEITAGRRGVLDILSNLQMREARNALVALGARGWEHKAIMPVEPTMAELQAASSTVAAEFERRLKAKKIPSFADVKQNWPEARRRIPKTARRRCCQTCTNRHGKTKRRAVALRHPETSKRHIAEQSPCRRAGVFALHDRIRAK